MRIKELRQKKPSCTLLNVWSVCFLELRPPPFHFFLILLPKKIFDIHLRIINFSNSARKTQPQKISLRGSINNFWGKKWFSKGGGGEISRNYISLCFPLRRKLFYLKQKCWQKLMYKIRCKESSTCNFVYTYLYFKVS